jgi:hypothetical protein
MLLIVDRQLEQQAAAQLFFCCLRWRSWQLLIIFSVSLEHAPQMPDVDGHGEDDGWVVLGSYGVQCLQVSQLKQVLVTNGNYDQFRFKGTVSRIELIFSSWQFQFLWLLLNF